MSRVERTGWRDEAYSAWHRSLVDGLDFLDIDWIEYCHVCKRELAVYELCADIHQEDKVAYKTKDVAEKLGVPGFVVLYHVTNGTVDGFRIRRLTAPASDWKNVSPETWARQLVALRTCHPIKSTPRPSGLPWPNSQGQNPDGTWGELGWFTEALYREWG